MPGKTITYRYEMSLTTRPSSRPAAALLADIWLLLNEPRTARGRTSSRSRPCGPEDDSCASVASSRAGAASAGA